jgi:hypothetical protein
MRPFFAEFVLPELCPGSPLTVDQEVGHAQFLTVGLGTQGHTPPTLFAVSTNRGSQG